MNLSQTVSKWFQNPEFAKLPTSDKRQVLANYFDGKLADDEFRQLDKHVRDRTRNNFVNTHIESFRPEAESRTFGTDLANTVKRAPAGIMEMLLQGVAMHDRLADRVAVSGPGLSGGSEEFAPGFDLKDWAAKKADELADWKEDQFPMSRESAQGGVRGAVTQGVESAMVSLGSKLPGVAVGLAAGGLPGAVAGYLTGVPLFGAAQYNEAEKRYLNMGYEPEEAAEAARLEAYSEMGWEFGSDAIELLTLGSGRVLTAPGKEILKESLQGMLAGSWKQAVKKGVAVTGAEATGELANTGTQAEIMRHYEAGTDDFWQAIEKQAGPIGVASIIFGGLGGGLHMANIRQTRQALENPVPDGLDEKEAGRRKLKRAEAVQEVEKSIKSVFPNLARQWRTYADQVVAANDAFDLGTSFEDAAAQEPPQDETLGAAGGAVADDALADERRAEQAAQEQERRRQRSRQVLETERQAAAREKEFAAALVAEQEQAASTAQDPFQPPVQPPAEGLAPEEMSPAQQMMQGEIPQAGAETDIAPAPAPLPEELPGQVSPAGEAAVMPGVNPAAEAEFVRQLVGEQLSGVAGQEGGQTAPPVDESAGARPAAAEKKAAAGSTLTGKKKPADEAGIADREKETPYGKINVVKSPSGGYQAFIPGQDGHGTAIVENEPLTGWAMTAKKALEKLQGKIAGIEQIEQQAAGQETAAPPTEPEEKASAVATLTGQKERRPAGKKYYELGQRVAAEITKLDPEWQPGERPAQASLVNQAAEALGVKLGHAQVALSFYNATVRKEQEKADAAMPAKGELDKLGGEEGETAPNVKLPEKQDALDDMGGDKSPNAPVSVSPFLPNLGKKQDVPAPATFSPPAERMAKGALLTADTEAGRRMNLRYAVVEAADLVTSHDDELAANMDYPARLQPRERTRDAYRLQVDKIAKAPRGAWLGANPKISEGAPVVTPDLVVLSGNGRSIGLRKAYAGETALPYRQWLVDHLGQFGIMAEALDNIKEPVLVRQLVDRMDMEELAGLAKEANTAGVSDMSDYEKAMADAELLASLDDFAASDTGAIDTAANRPFIRRFIGLLPQGEQNTMMDADGKLSQSGTSRIRNAVFAAAYPNQQVVARVVESTDNNIRNITNGMLQAAPAIARMRLDISAGELYNLDITGGLAAAVEDFARLRAEGIGVEAELAQLNLFGDPRTDLTKRLLRFFDQNSRSGKKVNDFLQAYVRRVRAAGNPKQKSLFGEKKEPAAMELVETAIGLATGNLYEKAQQSLFGDRPARPGDQDTGDSRHPDRGAGRRGEQKVSPDREGAADYGSDNKIVSVARYEELRNKLKDKLGRLNAGFDPELFAIGAEMAAYHIEAGARKFADFSRAMLGDEVLAEVADKLRPYLPGFYLGAKNFPGVDKAGMDSEADVERLAKEIDNHVSGTDLHLERDSRDAGTGDGVGKEDVSPVVSRAADGRGEGRVRADGQGPAQQGDHGVPGRGAAVAGKQGDQRLSQPAGEDGSAAGPAGGEESQRGGPADEHGAPDDQRADQPTTDHAAGPLAEHTGRADDDLARSRRQQAKANTLPVSFYSIDNIRESLPFLFPEQQDDVLKAEKRFYEDDGRGMLFTNGTGTGKTYTGLGVARRFFSAGKTEILLVVPKQTKVQDWIKDGENLGLSIRPLADTKDSGPGLLITTYANLYQNEALQARHHDLIIYDESHFVSAGKDGDQNAAFINAHRIAADHPDYLVDKAKLGDQEWRELVAKTAARKAEILADSGFMAGDKESSRRWQAQSTAWDEFADERRAIEGRLRQQAAERTGFAKVVFLSATPFAHHKSLLYADKYLFDVDEGQAKDETSRGYNGGANTDRWFMTNLGYRMRYNKLTQPESGVDVGLLERNLHQKLVAARSVSGRKLDVPFDYSREFVLLDSELGSQIDDGMDIVRGWKDREENKYEVLPAIVRKAYDYHYVNRLLETLKAREAVARVKKHLELGRKVVVFHDYIEGAPGHPFAFSGFSPESAAGKEVAHFNTKYPQYAQLDLRGLKPAITTMTQAFGDRVVLYNGRVPGRQRTENIRRFNDDDSGADVILVLRAAGKEGDSLHDVTGKHNRVFMDLGLPYSPPAAIQGEGRIYRVGQRSDAIMEYLVLHTSFEQIAYGSKINARVRTVENLAMGDAARDLDTAFKEGYLNAGNVFPHADQGRGGKEKDGNFEGLSEFSRARTYYYGRGKKTQRQKSREGKDYFATPEPVGMKMVEWGSPAAGEIGLEPSAGHGAIARFFPGDTTNHFVEPSSVLASQLAVNASGVQREGTFEELDPHNKYDFIIMNPPFGSGGSTAVAHLAKAVRHLRDGGRIVALLPEGPAADKKLDKFYEETKGVYLRGTVTLPAVTFERAATKVRTRVLVFDKVLDKDQAALLSGQNNYDLSNAENIEELFTRIEHLEMPARLPAAPRQEQAAAPSMPTAGGAVTVARGWHKQKGQEIFTATWSQRLDRDTYQQVAAIAKKHKGYWSRFSKNMVFEGSREDAEAFAGEVNPLLDSAAGTGVMSQREETTSRKEKYGPGKETDDTRELEREYRQASRAGQATRSLAGGFLTEVSVSERDADATQQLAKEFGRRVVFFHNREHERLRIGGTVLPGSPDVIYIHANTPKPYLYVLGHELTHRMELDAPHLFQKFHDAVMPLVYASPWKRYQERIQALQQSVGEDPLTYSRLESELLADFIGENFLEQDFWDQVAAREPSLFVRISRWVQSFLDKVLAMFKLRQGAGVAVMFSDLETARAAAAEAVADFLQAEVPAMGRAGQTMAQRTPAPVFFSAMQRHLAAKLPGSGSPSSFTQTINSWVKKGQIKAEELQWSGLPEWLAGQDQASRITKDELLAWLAENNLQVEEVVKGGGGTVFPHGFATIKDLMEVAENNNRLVDRNGQFLFGFAPVQDEAGNWNLLDAYGGDTVQYMGQQLLPAGGNYRELLFTLPVDQNGEHAARSARINQLIAQRDQLAEQPADPERQRQLRNLGVQIDMVMRESAPKYTTFHSAHWSEPNVLAHVRFNERTDADGKRLLFVEEVQSDWHQAGRKLGYGPGGVAPAPFAGTDKLSMLAMKRMVRWAADHGFDRIGWTTGEQQADRYDMSRYFKEIAYNVVTEENRNMQAQTIGEYHLEGITIDGSLHNFGAFAAEDLPGVVGKEMADKIVNGDGKESMSRIVGRIKGAKILSGIELSVGGEGMKAFYDKILPSTVNRLVKKWGVKVGRGKINHGDQAVEVHTLDITPEMRAEALAGQPLFMREPVENSPAAVARDLAEDRTFLNRLFAQRDLGQHLASVKTAALQKELQGMAGQASRRRHVLGFAYSKLKRSADSDLLDMALMVWRDVQADPDKVEAFRTWAADRLPRAKGEERLRLKEQLAVLDRMDRLTPEQLGFADRIGELFDQAGQVAQANKVIGGFRDNYVRRIWNLPQGRQDDFMSAGSGQGFKVFSTARMHRKFDTILDGWMAGYDLKVQGLTSSYGVYQAELEEILANKDFVRLGYGTRDLQGRRLFSTSRSGEYKDYVELEASGFAVWEWAGDIKAEKGPDDEQVLFVNSHGRKFFYSQVQSAPELWAVHRLDENGKPAKRALRLFGNQAAAMVYADGRDFPATVQYRPAKDVADAWERRKLYAPPQLAQLLNQATRKDRLFASLPGAQQLLRINASLKSWILLSSFFHHIAGTRSWAFGVDHGWRPQSITDPVSGETLRTAGINPVRAYKMGVRKIENLHPLIMRGVKNGLTLGNMQDWDESALRQDLGYSRKLARHLGLEAVDKAMDKGSRLRQGMADSLFKRYFAGLKAEAFAIEYVHELQRAKERFERGQGPAPDVDKVAERVARLINEDFGGLHLQRMGRHPTLQKILRLLLLAPDWCVDAKTRAMTKDGWRFYHELSDDDEIMAFDPQTHTLRWSRLQDKYVNQHYAGKMVQIRNVNRHIMMTPEHTCYARNFTTGQYDIVKAKDLQTNHLIPRCAPFPAPVDKTITDNLVRTVGWMVTDGHVKPVRWTRKDGSVGHSRTGKIKQAKPHTVKILKDMGFSCYVDNFVSDHGKFVSRHPAYVFSVPAKTISEMEKLGIKDNNLTWEFLRRLTDEQRQILYDTMMLGDGTGQKRFCGKEKEVFLMTMLQTMMGLPSTFYQQEKNCWRTRWITRGKDISCWGHHNNKREVDYSGTIWCPSVDTGFWLAEREGLMFITGNTESNFRMVSGLIPKANEWISKMVGDMQPTPGMRPHYNRFFAKVLLRTAASTFLLQILLNGWDDSEKFWKEQMSGENFYKFRWLYADISKIYQALGIDLEGKRKVFPVAGHFLDPLKLFDPPRLIKGKGSPIMRAGEALMGGTDWAERPFTGSRDFLATGKTVKGSPHNQKEGAYDRLPATLVNQVINMQPVQVGYFFKWLQGEEDTLSALLLSAGVGVHNAWQPPMTGPVRLADDPVSAEIERLTRAKLLHMGPPARTMVIGGIPQKLDRASYEEYVRKSSERVQARLLPLVQSEKWGKYDPERQAAIIRDVIIGSRKKARAGVKRQKIKAAATAGREDLPQ
jgi:hypothetical protein